MGSSNRWSRGQWTSAAATAVGGAAGLPARGWASVDRMFGNAAPGPLHEAVDTKLKAFPLSQVRWRSGIFLQQLESNQSFVESLPNERLLHTFRLTAGIPSTAEPLAGWEHLRGHFAGGHVLSAIALLHVATDDDAIKQKETIDLAPRVSELR